MPLHAVAYGVKNKWHSRCTRVLGLRRSRLQRDSDYKLTTRESSRTLAASASVPSTEESSDVRGIPATMRVHSHTTSVSSAA